MELPPVQMNYALSIFESSSGMFEDPIPSHFPLTFEQLRLRHGFVRYSTRITVQPSDPAILTIDGLADRALVFIDAVSFQILNNITSK